MKKISHIGIAVYSAQKNAEFYEKCLGMKVSEILEIPERQIRAAMVEGENVTLELIEPWPENEAVRRFLENRGEGLHHIAMEVKSIDEEISDLRAKGVEFLTDGTLTGAHGRRIIFISPKSANGVLIELCEVK